MSPRTKFSIMMFLEFFIWGAWLPLAFPFLGALDFTPGQKSWFMNAFAIASITGLFFSNQFADRNFAAERFLAFSHLVGGIAILAIGFVRDYWPQMGMTNVPIFWPYFLLMLIHSLFYVPTISITNSIAFTNLKDAQNDFGLVRLWGTIGWIAASLPFVFILVDWAKIPSLNEVGFVSWLGEALKQENGKTGAAFLQGVTMTYIAAGIASLLLAGFSLVLPHTPPKPAQTEESRFAWLESMKLLNQPFMLVLFFATFIDATVHMGYFILTSEFLINKVGIAPQWVMPVMSIGQVAEIGTMAILGFVLKRLGWRTTMILGILGHTARFGMFAFFPEAVPAILVNVLHGICYAFFFATVYIFVDEFFPKDARASAQGLFNFLIIGFGPLVGGFLWPYLQGEFTTEVDGQKIVDYQKLFLIPSGTALVAAVLLLLFFHPPRSAAENRARLAAESDLADAMEPGYPKTTPTNTGIKEGEPPYPTER
jgi:nucleoside transporter